MPVITIFGANGTQGSAVLEAVLASGKYCIRRALSHEVLTPRGAKRSSQRNTNFWDPEVFPADPKGAGELTQGKNLVDAAKEVGVKFFIWRLRSPTGYGRRDGRASISYFGSRIVGRGSRFGHVTSRRDHMNTASILTSRLPVPKHCREDIAPA
ncbi:hypothetical protein B0H14DRAFT_2606827 [Mycena olivaceomarginata]|nr:hypothetical protein B0H14DRAFT_2606827 [Mycena olivaceomarginata]